jgi:phosphate transport system substrate-binding protein
MRRAAAAAFTAAMALTGTAAHAAPVEIAETGSTLLYPVFNRWVAAYQNTHPGVRITTQSTGSGTGIADAISGRVQIGASDAYMSDIEINLNPGILNIPLAVSGQIINYNVPGFNDRHLKLSSPVLAAIYQGRARYWDDPAIAKLNAGVNLPHAAIVPVHRADGSGDTFVFTQYLSFSTPDWAKTLGYATTMYWPAVPGAINTQGNSGMVHESRTPYSVAYIGISYKSATVAAGLGEAAVANRDGQFVLPDAATVGAATAELAPKTPPRERVNLVFAPGPRSYPLTNYEYAIVKNKQPSAEIAEALRDFLSWVVDPNGGGVSSYTRPLGLLALPSAIVTLSRAQIDTIH